MHAPSSRDARRLYGDLAWTWPIISPQEHYEGEAEAAHALLREHSREPGKTLLHLGCGGGHLDRTLKKHYEVTGVDASEAMLDLARQLNPEVTYVHGDMRRVRLGGTFDAVAVFDSIDYMLTKEDLRAAFVTAHEHLRPGGVFVTYAEETTERFRQNRAKVTVRSKGDVHIVFLENAFDPDPSDTMFENVFVYLIRRDGRLEVETDRHLSGLFPFRTWLDLLNEVGFEVRPATPRPGFSRGEGFPWFVGVKPG
ncbi:MAG: class I SAM-dependent methyltransferase [Candidatus Thermoplasmatota archaeon]